MTELSTQQNALKIPFDSLTVCALVSELRAHLVGGQIQDIRQPSPLELQWGIRSAGQNYLLLFSADARFARLHLASMRRPNAATPPAFCMLLRKRLENSFIRDIRQRGFDRIVDFEIEARNEAGETVHYTFIGEFMGRHSNLILVDGRKVIVDSIKRIPHRINRLRETLPALPYLPPPDQSDKQDPFAPNAVGVVAESLADVQEREDIAAPLLAEYAGMSPFLANELAQRALNYDKNNPADGLRTAWRELIQSAAQEQFAPVYVPPRAARLPAAYPFPTVQLPQSIQESAASLNFALEDTFVVLTQAALVAAQLGDLRSRIEREIKALTKQQEGLTRSLDKAERAEEHKQAGELLLANIWRGEPGAASITVQDYFDPELRDRTLTLDSQGTLQENAEAYFRRYRKARGGAAIATEQQQKIEKTLHILADAKSKTDYWQGDVTLNLEPVQHLRAELTAAGLLRETNAPDSGKPERPALDFQGHKIRRVATPEGYEILIGESATANDFLTTRLAAPNDFWLHVRAAASSHVVVRTKGHPEDVPRSVLERAAMLCALHSAQKHTALVAVDYTLKKYVRKPRGAAAGGADYGREITLHVTPER